MAEPSSGSNVAPGRALELFKLAKPEYQKLIREILIAERKVMYQKRRNEIHQTVYELVKGVIK